MKKSISSLVHSLLCALMLTLAVFGGASTLSAQDIAGTWYFTGYVQETTGTESSYKAKRTESTVTFAPSETAGAYQISFLWDANRTTLVPSFEQKSANIWLKSFNGTEPNSGTAANLVKLVRIDDDTFLFYQARQLKDATGKLQRIESISGVLTAAVLPAKRDANWPGHFLTIENSFSASTDSIAPEDDGISYDEYHIVLKNKKYTVAAYGNYSEDINNDGIIDSTEFFDEDEVEKIPVKADGKFLFQKESEHQKSGSASLAIIAENSLFQLSDGRLGGISAGFSLFKYSSDSAEWGIYGAAVVLLPQDGGSPTPTDPSVNPDPVVTTPPVPTATVTAGKSFTLKVVVKPAGDKTAKQLTYQWYDGTGAAIIGATKATYTIKTKKGEGTGSGTYYVVVTNGYGKTVTSATSTVGVFIPPVITAQPEAVQSIVAGQTATFTVAANGTGPLTYQWRLNGKVIAGATSASILATDAGKYTVEVANAGGKAKSKAGQLKVVVPPAIVSGFELPASATVEAGKSLKLAIKASGTAKLTYKWFKDGVEIPKATAASYTIKAAKNTAVAAGTYKVVVTNSLGASYAVSSQVVVTVTVPVFIAAQSEKTVTAVEGSTATLSVTAGGDGPFTYQWKFKNAPLSGATNSTLVFVASAANAGAYVCEVSDSLGKKAASKTITLKVTK